MKGWVVVDRRKKKPVIFDMSYSCNRYKTMHHMKHIMFWKLEKDRYTKFRLKSASDFERFIQYASENGFELEQAETVVRLVEKEEEK